MKGRFALIYQRQGISKGGIKSVTVGAPGQLSRLRGQFLVSSGHGHMDHDLLGWGIEPLISSLLSRESA